ncbi:protein Njmu-R1-like [Lineus longissimus]|uniref:protein Njmu-R1-like n=1 Tax=Lineus longissimus TaxID=88925 RepID=UPI00315D0267
MADVGENQVTEEPTKSILKESSEKKNTISCHYALYTYHVNRPNCADTPEHSAAGEPSVADFLKKEATANGDFSTCKLSRKPRTPKSISSLSVIASDLSAEEETELRKLLARRITKGTVYAGAGAVVSVDLSSSLEEVENFDCYFSLLRQDKPAKQVVDCSPDVVCMREYVVCFLSNQDGGLELFRPELDKYSENLIPLLTNELTNLDTTIKDYLTNWHAEAVQYICRSVTALADNIQYIIHAALMGESDEFIDQEYKDDLVKDVHRFFDCCNLFESDNQSNSKTSSLTNSFDSLLVDVSAEVNMEKSQSQAHTKPVSPEILAKTNSHCSELNGGLSNKGTNKFCEDWAKSMQEQVDNNPVHLKQIIENHKLRVIQDMNHLKRLLRQAESDHYALFRAFIFLKTSNNGPILLHHAMFGEHTLHTPEATNVLTSLSQYIEEDQTVFS